MKSLLNVSPRQNKSLLNVSPRQNKSLLNVSPRQNKSLLNVSPRQNKMLKLLFTYLLLNVMLFSHARAQSITTTVCIEPKFGGLNAVFGYESREPNVTGIAAGPNNNLSLVPAEPQERQLTAFYPGYWQQGFAGPNRQRRLEHPAMRCQTPNLSSA
jgi:hypothetical protein